MLLIVVGFFQYKYQEQELENKFNFNADTIDKEFSNKISTIKGVVTSISSYYKSSPEMDSSSFSTLGNDLLSYYDYIDGVGFATIVNHDEKNSFKIINLFGFPTHKDKFNQLFIIKKLGLNTVFRILDLQIQTSIRFGLASSINTHLWLKPTIPPPLLYNTSF